MAYVLEAWAADGPNGEALICNKPISAVDIHRVTEEWRRDPNCVLVTLSRSTREDSIERIVWQRPGYSSAATPLERAKPPAKKRRLRKA